MPRKLFRLWFVVLCFAALCQGACFVDRPIHPKAQRLNGLGAARMQAGRMDQAQMALEVSLEYSPCLAEALHNLALLAFHEGHLDRAERLAQDALVCKPDLVQTINLQGALALARKRPKRAAMLFRRALDMDPGCTNARRNLIYSARLLGDEPTAQEEAGRLEALGLSGSKGEGF